MAQPASPITSDSLPPSDAELISASRAGDTAAYATLYERHSASAYALARHLMRGAAESDDMVNEAFVRVLGQLRRGAGPRDAFRPYLLTTVRRVAFDRFRAEQRQVSVDNLEAYDAGEPFVDPALAELERSLVARAYFSLPERWQAVLWHTAVEGARPAQIAESLGVTPNGAAALAYRAREALRQAYLQMHLAEVVRQECRPTAAKLGAFVRGGLSKRETAQVEAHVANCVNCQAARAELSDVNAGMRSIVVLIVAGPAYLALLASLKKTGLIGWFGGRARNLRHAPRHQQAVVAGGAVAVVAIIAALAIALTGARPQSPRHPSQARVPVAAIPPPPASQHHAPVAGHNHHAAAPAPVTYTPVTSAPAARAHPHHHPARHATLTASINPVGSLLRGGSGIVTFTVANAGRTAARSIDAFITLPPGVSDIGAGGLGMAAPEVSAPGGWSCVPTMRGARCEHGALPGWQSTTSYLRVTVAPDAPIGDVPAIRIAAGGRPVTARGAAGVASDGLSARYAANEPDTSVLGYGSFGRRKTSSTVTIALPGPVRWAGLYWAWAGRAVAAPIELTAPWRGSMRVSPAESDEQGGVHQGFADVTADVTSGGAWTAHVRTLHGARYLGWALVVITADPAAHAGQVMVLDGARLVSPSGSSFSVPADGLLPPSGVARVQAVTWQLPGGAAAVGFTEPPGAARIVSFSPGSQAYLAGVLVITEPPDGREYTERPPRAADFTSLGAIGRSRMVSGLNPDLGDTDLRVSRAEWKDGGAWIVARCSLTRAMSLRTAQWLCTGRAAANRFPGTTVGCCSSSRASPGSVRIFRCCAATGTKRPLRDAVRRTMIR